MNFSRKVFATTSVLALVSACSSQQAPADWGASENAKAASDSAAPAEAAAPAPAEIEGITNERLSFAPGTSSATVEGSITGYEIIDYLLNVRAGQPMNISLATRNTATYFNLLEPGETEVATFIGSTSGNQFEGVAKKNGDYRIRVYMMRSAARRNEKADYRLEAIVSGAAHQPQQPADALVPGTDYHATGTVNCRIGSGKMQSCDFGVKREGYGNGMVTVTRPDGGKRTILFERGKATGFDFSQADPAEFSSRQQDDNTVVRIGDETYTLPDAIIWGG